MSETAIAPKVSIEYPFETDADHAWSKLGRFGSIIDWQALVRSCEVEERQDGIYRVLVLEDESVFVERLESFSHKERSFSYSITSSPLPITDYRSELQIIPDGAHSVLLWRAWYNVPQEQDASEIKFNLEALFKNGIKGMLPLLSTQ
jgi:hypothetical protein